MQKISWDTVEYLHTHKKPDWYWIVGMITISIAIIAIILNNIIFAILIIVSAFTLALFASRPPAILRVEINQAGIILNQIMYPYTDLDSFWIETDVPHPKLIIKSKKALMHHITAFIEDAPPEEIHDILIEHLRMEKQTEPLLEKVLLYLGF